MPDWSLSDIPGSVVTKAQQDLDFALKLLHQDTRADALNEPDLDLTAEQRSELSSILDDIANMSFEQAIQRLRDLGNTTLM
jgi:hypothetical protein